MGKLPVISLSLKDIDAESYDAAFATAVMLVNEEAGRHYYLSDSEKLTGNEKQVLKTNSSLQLAVLTGCMRISRESIFTGLNNLNVLTIADVRLDECFGFTDEEVRRLLNYYGLSDKYSAVKEWYDGYRFGTAAAMMQSGVSSGKRHVRKH